MDRLFIIGNGFDLSHGLPTHFDPNFKEIAESMEQIPYFWEMYQTRDADIWANFENSLAHPDFNSLEEIFEGYQPDYLSDHESDRDAIITQVDLNGNLALALNKFAYQADGSLDSVQAKSQYTDIFRQNDLFVNFNYTHTIEKLYGVHKNQVLHIHGEVGVSDLILGYPEGNFQPEKYSYDVRQKGRGPYRNVDICDYIENMLQDGVMDFYTYTAYKQLINKTQSFKKKPQISLLSRFLGRKDISEIFVIGHSCLVDYPYFNYLNQEYSQSNWKFTAHDDKTLRNVENLVPEIGIANYQIEIP